MPSTKSPKSSRSAPASDQQKLVLDNQPFSLQQSIDDYEKLLAGQPADEPRRNSFRRLIDSIFEHRRAMNNPLKLRDYELKWRIFARKRYGRAFFIILLAQNIFVFTLVSLAYRDNRLGDLSLVLGVLVTGTLVETYFIFRIIVTQLFKDIRYKEYMDAKNEE